MTLSEKLRVPLELEGQLSYGAIDATAIDDEPAIRAVDEIFDSAIRARASDIHIEPLTDGGRVRERIDGILCESRRVSAHLLPRVLSRIKLLAGMDIADRRLPQDGRYTVERKERSIDARVASIPTIGGEKLAVRLLDTQATIPSLETLGMSPAMAFRYRELIHAPAGFVVVCGPTGSGKTTTLYASIAERNVSGQHLCSIEDPVEIRLPGVAQVQVNVRAGLTFAAGLRSFLRQDPNAIMIGEMRDPETATLATSAALCGQLVLTTLHSNDALCAVERLVELGVSVRGVGASVTGIVSQRLVRRLCPRCKRFARAGAPAQRFGVEPDAAIAQAEGCDRCGGSGYRGRTGLFEIAVMSSDLRHAVETAASPAVVRAAAGSAGYEPLASGAGRLILAGECSVDEVSRVLGAEVA
ncbi:MAG: GspE/PulE family protein [Candidatus Tumulicola sp.]